MQSGQKEEKMTFFYNKFLAQISRKTWGILFKLKCDIPWIEANTSVSLVPFRLAIAELWMLTLFPINIFCPFCTHPIFLGCIIQCHVSWSNPVYEYSVEMFPSLQYYIGQVIVFRQLFFQNFSPTFPEFSSCF